MLTGTRKFFKNVYSRFLVDIGLSMHIKGSKITGNKYYNENQTDHKTFFPIGGQKTTQGQNCKVAISSQLFGPIELSNNNIIGMNSVLIGNYLPIRISNNSIIGNSVNISSKNLQNDTVGSVNIGENVLIKDRSILKSCYVGDNILIGERVFVKEGVQINDNVIIEDGSVIEQMVIIPENTVWAGTPARQVRNLTAEDKERIEQELKETKKNYQNLNQTQIFNKFDQLISINMIY